MSGGILIGRTSARTLGRSLVEDILGETVEMDPSALFRDAARAERIARSHLAQVSEAEIRAASEGARNPLATALVDTEYRVRTIAATETFQAANEELVRAAEVAGESLGVELLKEWNAEFDACPVCREADGERVLLGASFSNGTPGSAHPGCRCWTELIEARRAA